MTLRLTEIHPSTVHFPIALAPTAVALDALGAATGNRGLLDAGRLLMPAAFASALLAGAAGALAQGAARVEGAEARSLLVTHRTLNIALTFVLGGLAVHRARRRRPGTGYLAAGLAASAGLSYSAYLGGRMSYEHGVGVAEAGGLRDTTEIGRDRVGPVLGAMAAAIGRALRETLGDAERGELVPALRRRP
jgi:uncharacterized membrane protein